MHLNQCKTAKKNPSISSGFFTFMHFELRPACRRARNVVPICFTVEKFPREVKGLGQGYMEVKDRNHPNCLPLRKGDLIGQQCPFSRSLASGAIVWGPTDGSGCLQSLPVSPGFYTALGVRESLFLQCCHHGGTCYIFPLLRGCVLAQGSQVLSRHTADVSDRRPGRHQVSQ